MMIKYTCLTKECENRTTACYAYCAKCQYVWKKSKECRDRLTPRGINKEGYAWIRDDRGNITPEHRAVMERILGRKLIAGESVHHINGERADNREENLELWLKSPRFGVRAKDLCCPHCSKTYL